MHFLKPQTESRSVLFVFLAPLAHAEAYPIEVLAHLLNNNGSVVPMGEWRENEKRIDEESFESRN